MEQEQTYPQPKKSKIKIKSTTVFIVFVIVVLIFLGFFTYVNYRNIKENEQTSTLFQKGMQLRNSYATLNVGRVDRLSYTEFSGRLLELRAEENTIYSYKDDYYKNFSDPNYNANKTVIYLSERQVFDDPIKVAKQPECEAIARIESEKRQPLPFEDAPAEVNLKYSNNTDAENRMYVYTPKNGHCSEVFSDTQLLRVQKSAMTIRYSF